MSACVKVTDGLFMAVKADGTVAVGANRSGPKLYVYESVAIKRAGQGGRVYRVTDSEVKQVWPKAVIFFLNEQHELPPVKSKDDECVWCGKSSCYGSLCFGID